MANWLQEKGKAWGDAAQQFITDPRRVFRAQATGGLSESAPILTGKKDWNAAGIGTEMGPPGGATPLVPQIENPYVQPATQAATGLAGMLPQYGQLYGTGAGAVGDLIGNLKQQAAGTAGPGKSLGQALLQQGLTQNMAAVQSQLASQRGLSPAIRARMAAQQTAALQGQSAQQAAMLGYQQQLAAQQQLGQLGMGAAQLGSEGQLKGTGILTGASTDLAKIQANIAAANQAAKAADKARTVQAVTSALGAGGQLIASGLGGGAGGAALTQASSPTGIYDATPNQGAQYQAYAAHGGRIDGTAPYAGDTPKNDVVKANLSPGEIVIPRSAAGSKEKAKAFIEALDDWDEEPSYSKVLKARQKKNYSDGGVVPFDEEMARMYAPTTEQMLRTPIPAAQKMKESFDKFLTERVVDPLAQRGYPTLGAALATVPSTAMEAFVPSTPEEAMAGVIPLPGLKGKALQSVKRGKARGLLDLLKSDDVDISKLPSFDEYKKLSKVLKKEKLTDETEKLLLSQKERKTQAQQAAKSAVKDIFENPKDIDVPSFPLEDIAQINLDIPEIKNAWEKFQILARNVPHLNQDMMNLNVQKRLNSYQNARKNLFDVLKQNKDKLKFDTELEQVKKVRKFPQNMFGG